MAQTSALFYADGLVVDYTPGSAVIAGEVILLGTRPCIAPVAIAASVKGALAVNGIFQVPQKAEIFTAGDAVYWDVDGTPVTGTALSGAATGTASAGYLMGIAAETTAATDTYVKVVLRGVTSTATIGGSITAADIEAEDASLGVNGLDAAQGGAIAIAGGTSSTSGNAGGAVTLTGGTPGATGAGGAVTATAGTGGTTSGAAGAASLVGGAGNGTTNGAGGTSAITGGAGKGNAAGGAVAATGGIGGATGAGGAASVVGGAGGSGSGTGGAAALTGGAGTAGNANGGAVAIDGGAPHSSGAAGAITIGTNNAASITLGKMPRIPVTSFTAGGTAIGNANNAAEGFNVVTGADDTAAVILPVAVAGAQVIIKSITAAKNLIVFPQVGSTINNVGANNAYNMVADEGCSYFIAKNATQWYSLPLVSS